MTSAVQALAAVARAPTYRAPRHRRSDLAVVPDVAYRTDRRSDRARARAAPTSAQPHAPPGGARPTQSVDGGAGAAAVVAAGASGARAMT
ncbi:hypothetical protein SHIRM173S_09130 [Streptomyces hirsutus]